MTAGTGASPSPSRQLAALAVAGFGQNLLFTTVNTFLLVFVVQFGRLSTAGIAVVTAAIGVARIADAVTDPIVGGLVDLTRTRWGRLRPYVLFAAAPIAVLTTLLFVAPPLPEAGKLVWFGVVYALWGVVYTVGDVPFWGLTGSVFPDPAARTRAVSAVRAVQSVALGAATLGMPWLAQFLSFGTSATAGGWTLAVALVSVLGMAMFLTAFAGTRERATTAPRQPFRSIVASLVRNRPLLVVLVASVLGFGRFMVQAGGATFALVAYRDERVFTVIGAAIILGIVLASIGAPRLLRRVSGRTAMVASNLVAAALSLGMFAVGVANVWALAAFVFAGGLTLGVFLVVQVTLIADAVDAAEERTGTRNDGVSFASLTFVSKVMSALALLVFGAFLVLAGYADGVRVTSGMRQTVFAAITLVPAASAVLSAAVFSRYRLPAGAAAGAPGS